MPTYEDAGSPFSVADAYENRYDLDENEVLKLLEGFSQT